ncbi:MAG TPA: UDP-N-acetylglucosamine 1-carboxyvinyltransferase [bacterium]|nr:UDP-N-acetylglucosamine 1-carboxyvinyltransferase [bacterium]
MDKLVIRGGKPLSGRVRVSGAKNAALPAFCATILAPGRHVIRNAPNLKDVQTTIELLRRLGVVVDDSRLAAEHVAEIDTSRISSVRAPYDLVKTMRASILVLGPLLAREGKAEVSLPGGCAIGARPVNLHLKGLETLGASIRLQHGYIIAQAGGLKGAEFAFDVSTVTGTENLMMAAALAQGTTVLTGSAMEPEVTALAEMLVAMGADIHGLGTTRIEIRGGKPLHPVDFTIMPDRIEAGTYMAAAACTRGEVLVEGANAGHMEAVIAKFREAGVTVEERPEGLLVKSDGVRAVDVKTQPYPGFPTDMQAQFMVLMCMAKDGISVIAETVFENRFMHVLELQRMGADIRIDGHSAIIHGRGQLSGTSVMATDLRASASLALAGLAADGETEILRIYHLDRGYEKMEEKLKNLGADMERVKGAGL